MVHMDWFHLSTHVGGRIVLGPTSLWRVLFHSKVADYEWHSKCGICFKYALRVVDR